MLDRYKIDEIERLHVTGLCFIKNIHKDAHNNKYEVCVYSRYCFDAAFFRILFP